ncbi:MAG: hypothetical protein IPO91_29920 [Chloroflexi bacterium]|nr:hypothetical protein [Chloroflexota bacterium]
MTTRSNNLGAYILIGLGVLFLAGQIFDFDIGRIFDISWPLFVVIPGVIFLIIAFTGDRRAAGFIIPGAIVTGTGLILWFQDTFDRYETWAYVWTLYPVFVGAATMYLGTRLDNAQQIKTGRNLLQFGLIAFVVAAAFFELLIFNSNASIGRWLVPGLLILAGGYMLFFRRPSTTSDLFSEKDKRG